MESKIANSTRILKVIAKSLTEFLELPYGTVPFQSIADGLLAISGSLFVMVSSYNSLTNAVTPEAISGPPQSLRQVERELGFNPLGINWPVNLDLKAALRSGRLVKISGLHELSFGQIPQSTCLSLENSLNLTSFYVIGMIAKNELLGILVIIMDNNKKLQDPDLIEIIAQQAAGSILRSNLEQKLYESKEAYRSIIDNARDAIFVADAKTRYLTVNPAACTLLGYTEAELLQMEIRDLLTEEQLELGLGMFAELVKKGHFCGEIELKGKNNKPVPVELNASTLPNGNYLCSARNITERKQAENSLKEKEKRLRRITDNMLDIISQTDREGIFEYVSPSVKATLGYEPEYLLGKSIFAFFHPDDLIFARTKFENDLKTKTPGKVEIRYRHADGRYIWLSATESFIFDSQGEINGLIFNSRDVTAKKQAEESLILSEERFSKAFTNSPNMMSISTLKEGKYIDVSNSFLQTSGYKREEVVGKTALEVKIWSCLGKRREFVRDLSKNGTLRNVEIELRTKSGEMRPCLISAEIIELNGQKCMLAVMNDLTEKKQLQMEVERLDRLNLIGQMAASLGHEIRNPLTTVKGFLQILATKKETADYACYFQLMIEELDRTNSIITEFLALAKDKPVELSEHKLNDIINAIYPLIQGDALSNSKYVILELADNMPSLLLDPKEIRQLILNLARNGLEAMEPGGFLTVKTFLKDNEPVLSIQDQGKGIPQEVLKNLGTPFFTTKEQGTGLGLAICYSIANRHNAAIDVETDPEGTRFSVRFKGGILSKERSD